MIVEVVHRTPTTLKKIFDVKGSSTSEVMGPKYIYDLPYDFVD